MSTASKAFGKGGNGRVGINVAGSAVKHGQVAVGSSEVELTAGLANRRYLWIKPVATGNERFIYIGESGFSADTTQATIVFEKFEMGLPISSVIQVFAVKDDLAGDIDVRVLEVGDA